MLTLHKKVINKRGAAGPPGDSSAKKKKEKSAPPRAARPPGDASALWEREKDAPPDAHEHGGAARPPGDASALWEREKDAPPEAQASNGGGHIFEDDLEGTGSVVHSLVDYGPPNSDSYLVCSPILERDGVGGDASALWEREKDAPPVHLRNFHVDTLV